MMLDIERCRRGMKQLDVVGRPRAAMIEEAIASIHRAPQDAFQRQYFGIKNYAGFGDQREDHEYQFGPKHGTIVFSIGRTREFRGNGKPLDADAIYYLEAYRDFAPVKFPSDGARQDTFDLTLAEAIRKLDWLTTRRDLITNAFAQASVDAHVVDAASVVSLVT